MSYHITKVGRKIKSARAVGESLPNYFLFSSKHVNLEYINLFYQSENTAMKRSILITVLIFTCSLKLLAEKNPEREYWVFKDKFTVKALQMDSDHNFSWYYKSGTGHSKFKELYKNSGDTIFLQDPSRTICLVRKENKLYTYFIKDQECSEFQPLTKVSRKKYRHLIKKHSIKDREENETDKMNKTASDAAPFLEFLWGRRKY